MTQVTVRKSEPKGLLERIRERAFELFQRRGNADGFAVEDWLKAEHEFQGSGTDVVEKKGAFELEVAVPGFEAGDVQVFVTPAELTVRAERSHQEDSRDGDISISQFSEQELFRSFPLPAPIDVDKVTAKLNKGVLKLVAAKAA